MKDEIREYLYFAEFSENKKRNTIVSFEKDLRQFREYLEKNVEITEIGEITPLIIRSFFLTLHNKNVTNRSMNRKLSTLRMFFDYLVDRKIIHFNPTQTISFLDFTVKKPEILTIEEIDKIREVIPLTTGNGIRDRLMVELLYSSGITMTEMLSLGEGAFDLDSRELYVGSGNHMRIVYISRRTCDFFRKYIIAKKKKYKERYTRDILFVNGLATRLSDRSLRRIIAKYVKYAEIEKEISPYAFRHTYACHMLKYGMNIYYLKELLGHVDIESTKYYLDFI